MVADVKSVSQELAIMKLDYLLEEFHNRKEPLPVKMDLGDDDEDISESTFTNKEKMNESIMI